MSTPKNNYLHIDDTGAYLNGVPLLLEDGGIDIRGYDSAQDVMRVDLTLIAPHLTISPGT